MTPLAALSDRPDAPAFTDGLGERVPARDGATGEPLQILRLRPALTAVPSFEFALRERTARLANFRHAYYSRVRRIDRAMSPTPSLSVVSEHVEGMRLSDMLAVARDRQMHLDINAALCLIRQLVPAVALLHENARDVAHGLIAPERLVVTPHARLVIVEHVLGAAVEQLHWSRERLWREFRVAVPPSAGVPRLDHRADVIGIGVVALSLVLGRPLDEQEFPQQLPALLEGARERSPLGDLQPLSAALRAWLARALQLDVRRAFASAPEALAALDEVVGDDSGYVAAPIALETFLSRYVTSGEQQSTLPPAFVAPVVHPVAAPSLPEMLPAPAAPPPVPELSDILDLSDLVAERLDVDAPVEAETVGANAAAIESPAADPEPTGVAAKPPRGISRRTKTLLAVLVLAAVAAGGYQAYLLYGPARAAAQMGTLVVQSSPSGVQVFVDGVERGVTPARLTLAAGAHILELRSRGVPRVIPLTISAGGEVSQYLEFAETAAAPVTGHLSVQSVPPGARVFVDGTERGVAPLSIQDLAPGEHQVTLESDFATVKHVVSVQAGATASLVAPMSAGTPAGPVSGWITVKAPFTIEIHEGGRLIGTTDTERVMLAAGKHDLELVNASLGLRLARTVQVLPGRVTAIPFEPPMGTVHLNATPWAEVWIDGRRAGETPLGNVPLTVGPHEIVFRHPQLGEKRHAVAVTLGAPVRVSVDMK